MISRIDSLKELLSKEPNDSFLNYALGLEYAKTNEIQKAIDIIASVIEKDENYLGAYYQLGQLHEQKQQMAEAMSVYKRGVLIARKQNNLKALGEFNTALSGIED